MFAFACPGLLRDPPKLFSSRHIHLDHIVFVDWLYLERLTGEQYLPDDVGDELHSELARQCQAWLYRCSGPWRGHLNHIIRTHDRTGRARSPLHRLFLRSPQGSSTPRPEHSWPYSDYRGSGRADNECPELLADIAALQNGTPIYFNALLVGEETFSGSHGLGPVERGTLEALFTTAPTSVIVSVQLTNPDTFAVCLIPSSAARARANTLSALRRAAWRPSSTVRSLRRCRQQCIPVATIPMHPRLARSNDVLGTPALGSGTSSASSGP